MTDCLFVNDEESFIKVAFDEIDWLKAEGNYTMIHAHDQRIIIQNTFKEVESKLPESDFMRVHRSYIVRLDAVEAFDSHCLRVGDNMIPMNRRTRTSLSSRFNILNTTATRPS